MCRVMRGSRTRRRGRVNRGTRQLMKRVQWVRLLEMLSPQLSPRGYPWAEVSCERPDLASWTQQLPNMKPSMHMPRCWPSVFRHSQTNIQVPCTPDTSQARGAIL